MEILIIAVLIGLIPAAIARGKGHSFILWWVFGAALFCVALPAALLLKTDNQAIEQNKIAEGDMKKCPFCAELIKREAAVCRYCGRDLDLHTRQPSQPAQTVRKPTVRQTKEILTAAEPAPSEIYLFFKEQQHGPFSFAQVQQMRVEQKIPDTALYWRDGLPEWAPITDFGC